MLVLRLHPAATTHEIRMKVLLSAADAASLQANIGGGFPTGDQYQPAMSDVLRIEAFETSGADYLELVADDKLAIGVQMHFDFSCQPGQTVQLVKQAHKGEKSITSLAAAAKDAKGWVR